MTSGITVYPVDAVSGAPQFTGRMAREALGVLSAGATSSRPLGGRSGIRPGTGTCVTATSTTWTVTPHGGVLDLQAAAEAGPYLYAINANQGGTLTAADGTNARVDIVYLTLNDPAEGDGTTTPDVVPGYLAGTAAASPVAPSAPARSMVLAQINVPKSGGGSPTVTMVAPFAVAAGAPIPVRSQTERDALPKWDGLLVNRIDTDVIERCDGTTWKQITPGAWQDFVPLLYSGAGATQIGTVNNYARWRLIDQWTVQAQVSVTRTSGVTVTDGLAVSLPLTASFRSLNCGTLYVCGSSTPAAQSGMAFMSADKTKLIPVAVTNGYLNVDPSQEIRYNVTYERA